MKALGWHPSQLVPTHAGGAASMRRSYIVGVRDRAIKSISLDFTAFGQVELLLGLS